MNLFSWGRRQQKTCDTTQKLTIKVRHPEKKESAEQNVKNPSKGKFITQTFPRRVFIPTLDRNGEGGLLLVIKTLNATPEDDSEKGRSKSFSESYEMLWPAKRAR